MTRARGRPGRPAVVVAAGAILSIVLVGCGDGRPAFCDDLARSADLSALSRALEARNLPKAREAAAQFRELADGAPEPVRGDLTDLADSVVDIVGLLGAERTSGPAATTTAPGSPGTPSDTPPGDPADVERLREDLNRRLAELSATSSRVENWASRECGINLG
jgi:hypothetical protein